MLLEFDFEPPTIDKRDKGYVCNCCGLFVKRYKRSLNSNMALALLCIYKSGNRDYIHLENLMHSMGYKRSGDASYLIHWRFLERCKEIREDGSGRNGKYKITSFGILFCESKISAKEKVFIFNNTFQGFDGGDVYIKDVLCKKFDYNELMKK